MSGRKSRFADAVIGAVVPTLLFLFGGVSDRGAKRLAKFVAGMMRLFYRPGVRLIRANLSLAFPNYPKDEIRRLSNANLMHLAWNWIDFLRILKNPMLVDHLMEDVEGENEMAEQLILCLPHLGSWELLAQYIPKLRPDSAAVADGTVSAIAPEAATISPAPRKPLLFMFIAYPPLSKKRRHDTISPRQFQALLPRRGGLRCARAARRTM